MLLSTAVLGWSVSLGAQAAPLANEPGGEPDPPTTRLPAPATVSAAQERDGRIRVAWSVVDGAVSYSVTRSVPPVPATTFRTAGPDTQYVETNVKPGSTYFYTIAAINEAGLIGLKRGTAAVKAEQPGEPPVPPGDVKAAVNGKSATVTWKSVPNAVRYRVELSEIKGGGAVGWVPRSTVGSAYYTEELAGFAPGTSLMYRVRAEDSRNYLSDPGVSNEITVPTSSADTTGQTSATDSTGGGVADSSSGARTNVRPAVVAPGVKIKVGGSLKLAKTPGYTNLHLSNARWVSLDESKASVDSRGQVQARSPGVTNIIAIGMTADGSVASLVQRVDVTRR
jgi:Big-like domain-containing protein